MKNSKKWTLLQTNSISSYILNEKNYNPFEKYPVNATLLKMRIKSLKQNTAVAGMYSERCCHVTYVNLKFDRWVKNSDSQSVLSNGHHKATTDFTWVIVSLDSGVSTSVSLFSILLTLEWFRHMEVMALLTSFHWIPDTTRFGAQIRKKLWF